MYKFPGEDTNLLIINQKPYKQYGYPNLGSTCLVKVLKTTFLCANVEIIEVNGLPTMIPFAGIIKLQVFSTTEYISDLMKVNDVFECTVVSYGDLGIYLVKD
ncbi:hypothetical protein NBO_628g0004 [Nosema bombycis CQ1]|uniref:Uncharacterized protein n=1 Tax=Nosema bombycis (strain CQ1 / CVCC 102059) TaxID=578461 RepID=R0MD20_NOSB1|nr:hypothetical protein NBO_628g0004 [Nosema bombycis CQ1]|eukprot:EOB11935.1 hypothetical protein NBO_628g0004 [Nosema bombycis CQ1]